MIFNAIQIWWLNILNRFNHNCGPLYIFQILQVMEYYPHKYLRDKNISFYIYFSFRKRDTKHVSNGSQLIPINTPVMNTKIWWLICQVFMMIITIIINILRAITTRDTLELPHPLSTPVGTIIGRGMLSIFLFHNQNHRHWSH